MKTEGKTKHRARKLLIIEEFKILITMTRLMKLTRLLWPTSKMKSHTNNSNQHQLSKAKCQRVVLKIQRLYQTMMRLQTRKFKKLYQIYNLQLFLRVEPTSQL
jgi:hypothetical protein